MFFRCRCGSVYIIVEPLHAAVSLVAHNIAFPRHVAVVARGLAKTRRNLPRPAAAASGWTTWPAHSKVPEAAKRAAAAQGSPTVLERGTFHDSGCQSAGAEPMLLSSPVCPGHTKSLSTKPSSKRFAQRQKVRLCSLPPAPWTYAGPEPAGLGSSWICFWLKPESLPCWQGSGTRP